MNRRHATLMVLNSVATSAFVYGTNDCYQIVAQVAQAITGKRPGIEINYTTEDEARALVDARGGHVAFVSSFLGESVKPYRLRDGDAALIEIPDSEPAMGIVFDGAIFVKSPDGMHPLKLSRAIEGWHIG